MVEFICPQCGSVLRAEEGTPVICACCGLQMIAGAGGMQQDTQFLQQPDMPRFGEPVPQQYAQQPQQPYAQPYVQQYPQMPYAQQPYIQQQPVMRQQPQYTEEERLAAKKKRNSWHLMNAGFFLLQSLLVGLGVHLDDMNRDIGVFMILGWVLSLAVCPIVSAVQRPDDAFIEKPPAMRSKVLQVFLSLLLGFVSAITGAIIYGLFSELF